MQVKFHRLPDPHAMVGGLALDALNGCVWLGLGNSHDFITRFDLGSNTFQPETAGRQLAGWSYVHRSIVPAADGRVYLGVSWVLGARPRTSKPSPMPPGVFGTVLGMIHALGGLLSQCKILRRERDGTWKPFSQGRTMSADLAWDPVRQQLLRLSVLGISGFTADGDEAMIAPSMRGFSHELALGPAGELVQVDRDGNAHLVRRDGSRIQLGSLLDVSDDSLAAPGIDALVSVGQHYLVGGTRNRARPFVIDLRVPSLTVLPPVQSAPRASAFAVSPTGKVYFAAGVGTVGLYRLDPETRAVELLGKIEADGVPCHHLHDLVVTADGRIFGGEFYPLDVPKPPWPKRDCYLWEAGPVEI